MNRTVFVSLSILCLLSVSPIAGFIQVVKADGGSVYIRADGSIDPPTAPISTINNVTYTLTGNISLSGDFYYNMDAIVIERDNIVLNGAGHTVHGTGRTWPASGISLTGRSNVTIKNVNIYDFRKGIYLVNSSNNIVSGNNVSVLWTGINLEDGSNNNTISGNNGSIELASSSYNTISGNLGRIELASSSYNTISGNHGLIALGSSSNNNTISGNHGSIALYSSSNNTVSGNDASADPQDGIFLSFSSNNNIVSGNNVTANGRDGIYIDYASNHNVVSGNNASANGNDGIHIIKSSYNVVSGNNASANGNGGIHFYISYNNTVSGNDASANAIGIDLEDGSSNNTVCGNTVTENGFAVRFHLYSPSNNTIYHNNFIGNAFQVSSDGSPNIWDDGYSSGGNYWSDHNGTDTNHDGIGDTPYIIDADNIDHYPLMGMFYSIDITFLPGSTVTLTSNSTISLFDVLMLTVLSGPIYSIPNVLINFTDQAGYGFCRVSIPHALMNISNTPVLIDYGYGTVLNPNYTLYDNGSQRWIYFAYDQSPPNQTGDFPARIMIIPEFPSFLILPLFFMATLLAVIAYKRKHASLLREMSPKGREYLTDRSRDI